MRTSYAIIVLLLVMAFPSLTLQCAGTWIKNSSYKNPELLSFLKNETGPISYTYDVSSTSLEVRMLDEC
jgi:hypothetical protein